MKMIDKTILVTGGNSGIGKCVVNTLLEMGSKVFAVDLNIDQLIVLKDKYTDKYRILEYYQGGP